MKIYSSVVSGSLKVHGDITAETYITKTNLTKFTQSFSSGSTIFGDSADDTHQFTGSAVISGSLTVNGTDLGETTTTADTYLRKQYVKKVNSIIIPSTASFTAVTASAPAGMTSTSENDFLSFINGQYMESDALTIQQVGSTFYLKVDTDSIGYELESDDEILVWGKFDN